MRNKHHAGDLYIITGHQDQERSSFTSRGDLLPLVTIICILRAAAAACLAHRCSVESKTPVFVAKPQGIFFFLSVSGSNTHWRCCCPLNSPCRQGWRDGQAGSGEILVAQHPAHRAESDQGANSQPLYINTAASTRVLLQWKFCFLTSTSCTNTHTKPWSCSRQLYQLSCMPGIVQNCLTKDWFLAGYGFHESSSWVHVESTELHLPCLQQPKHLALSNIVLQLFCDKVKQLKWSKGMLYP